MNVYKIAISNVKSLHRRDKFHNLIHEMKCLKIKILECIRSDGSHDIKTNGYSVYYSGSLNGTHQNGVVVILKNDVSGSLLFDRMMLS